MDWKMSIDKKMLNMPEFNSKAYKGFLLARKSNNIREYSRWKKEVEKCICKMDKKTRQGWKMYYHEKSLLRENFPIRPDGFLVLVTVLCSCIFFIGNYTAQILSTGIIASAQLCDNSDKLVVIDMIKGVFEDSKKMIGVMDYLTTVIVLSWIIIVLAYCISRVRQNRRRAFYNFMCELFNDNNKHKNQ